MSAVVVQKGSTRERHYLRVLVHELGAVVHLVVDHEEDVLLGVVLGNILVGILLGLGGHCVGLLVG